MSVTFDKLLNWPDPGTIDSAALDLSKHGEEFGLAVEDAKSVWGRLPGCYETPHQDRLYQALDSAVEFATAVSSGTATAASALGVFSSTLASMRSRRDNLIAQAKAANAASVPTGEAEAEEQAKQHRELQRQIDAHAKAYEEAVTQCEQDISRMRDDGLPAGWRESEWASYAGDSAISTLAAGAESRYKQVTQVRRRLIFRMFGKNLPVPLPGETRVRTSWRFGGKPPSGTYGQRFVTLLRQAVLGPPLGRYSPWRPLKPGPAGRFGVGLSVETRSKIGVSGWGKVGGRAFGLAGAGLTFASEWSRAQERFKEQEPGLSEAERNGKVAETATVRTASQIGTAMFAGATIGSAIPVGGTVVGLAVGLGVGAAMSVEVGGKSLGDRAADGGEWVYRRIKGIFS